MAIGIHVVYVMLRDVKSDGSVLDKATASITDMRTASDKQPRVIADSAIASSAGHPTVKTYLEREAAAGYTLNHMTQTMIVTYKQADLH